MFVSHFIGCVLALTATMWVIQHDLPLAIGFHTCAAFDNVIKHMSAIWVVHVECLIHSVPLFGGECVWHRIVHEVFKWTIGPDPSPDETFAYFPIKE